MQVTKGTVACANTAPVSLSSFPAKSLGMRLKCMRISNQLEFFVKNK